MLQMIKANILTAAGDGGFTACENSYLVCEDGKVRGIFPVLPAMYQNVPVEDFGDALLLPSFCDLHLHAPQFPMHGTGFDLQLIDWLNAYAFPTEAAFADPAYARTVYRQLAQTLIRNGTTRVCMFASLHREATLVLMQELERAGVTGYVGKVNMDRNGAACLQETTEESMRETLLWLEACGDFSLVRPILTPRFTPSCTNELMAWLGELAAKQELRVQSHLSENPKEIEWVRELHPDCAQYWETYAKYGLWKPYTAMAHCVHSDARERAAMRDAGVYMVHCPDSNTNIRSGFAPVRLALQEGLRVALGSDIAGGAHLAMPDVVTDAIRVSKNRCLQNPAEDFLTFGEGFYLATGAGASYFGAGTLAEGEPLHALVLSDAALCPSARKLSLPERLERLFYLWSEKNVLAVYSQGVRRV